MEEAHQQVEVVVEEVLVHRDRPRGAVVHAEPAILELVEIDAHDRAPAEPLRGGRPLDVDGIHLASHERLDPLPQPPAPPRSAALGGVPDLDEARVVQREPRGRQRAPVALQAHAARDAAPAPVLGDVRGPESRERQPLPLQIGGRMNAGAGPHQDRLPLVDPGQADQPGGRPCALAGMANRLPPSRIRLASW